MSGVVIKFDAAPIRPPVQPIEVGEAIFCPCDYRCDFEEKVFASDKTDLIENDITDFLFKKVTPSDTITIKLLKGSVSVATITDNTYGEYFNGFDAQPLYVGWLADWSSIYDVFGGGRYQVEVTTVILGQSNTFKSRYFRLNVFDPYEADQTVKLRARQSGIFENGLFDFRDLYPDGWPTSIRLEGTFGKMQPSLERDIYQDSSFREVQNRDMVTREFSMVCNLVPETIQDRIATEYLLGNTVFVTSYNLLQEKKYENFPVVPESFNEVRYDGLGNTHFEITFSDRQKNIIKTNVQ